MANMLAMSALQFRRPMALFILIKSNDGALHRPPPFHIY